MSPIGSEHDEYAQVQLRLVRGPEPIAGICHDELGGTRSFWGWLELISALESARARGPAMEGGVRGEGAAQT